NVSGNGMCGQPPPAFPRAADPANLGTFPGQPCWPSSILAFLALRPDNGWLRRSRAINPKGKPPLGAATKHELSLDSIYRTAMDKDTDDLSPCASPALTATGTGSGSAFSAISVHEPPAPEGAPQTGPGTGSGRDRRDAVLEFIATRLGSMRQLAAASSVDTALSPEAGSSSSPRPCSSAGPLEGAPSGGGGSGPLARLASRVISQRSSQLSAEIQQWE
ncbi:hypothetical protein ABPG75_007083, partial [Micractinium tetrahymenae]